MASVNRITAVAHTTYRETIRNRIMLNMLGFAIALMGLSWVISSWSIGEPEKIIMDLGLTTTALVGVIIAIFTGIVLVFNEVDKRTILPILAKPLPRWEFVVGKFFGFSGAVLTVYAGMNLLLVLLLLIIGQPITSTLIQAIAISAWEVELVVAIALLFSSFSTPTVSAILTIMLFIAGRFSGDIKLYLENYPTSGVESLLNVIYAVIPHLSYFNFRAAAVHDIAIPGDRLLWANIYGITYCLAILIIAAMAFRNRDLA